MRYITDDEIQFRCSELERMHRSDWCVLVFDAAVGRTIQEVAEVAKRGDDWVRYHLARHAIEIAVGAEVEDTKKEKAIATQDRDDNPRIGLQLWTAIREIVKH